MGRATGGVGFGAASGVHAAGMAQELQRQVSALQQQLIFAQEEVSETRSTCRPASEPFCGREKDLCSLLSGAFPFSFPRNHIMNS